MILKGGTVNVNYYFKGHVSERSKQETIRVYKWNDIYIHKSEGYKHLK